MISIFLHGKKLHRLLPLQIWCETTYVICYGHLYSCWVAYELYEQRVAPDYI